MEFKLNENFLSTYKTKEPSWGPLGEFTYMRTYSRRIEAENRNEVWWETVKRVVEGTYAIQKKHCDLFKLGWNGVKAHKSAEKMFDKIFNFKFLPPGRGLWMMGTDFVEQKGSAALNNCAFISSTDIDVRGSFFFSWIMDALMLGVGVGFDTKGAGKILIKQPKPDGVFRIPDSREGWVESLALIIDSYFYSRPLPTFDYALIRPAGAPIKGFGGTASGPDPLEKMHKAIITLLSSKIGERLLSTDIVDVVNMISVCVVAGNVRRSACIAVGDYKDEFYVKMKDYNLYPDQVKSHRWASNNSIFAEVGKTKYSDFVDSIALNGEPGIIFLDNMRKYSRLIDPPDWKDRAALGPNPCFVGSTRVVLENDTTEAIENLVGKRFFVISAYFNLETKRWQNQIKRATAFKTGHKPVITLLTQDGSFITCTPDHEFATPDGKWIQAKDLVGRDAVTYDGTLLQIDTILDEGLSEDVYDLNVDDNHNFYVVPYTAVMNKKKLTAVLVHNCGEQTLENGELCCLVETFPSLHESLAEYKETLKYAYLYAKTVTLIPTHWPETNAVLLKNRRIGLSQSGIQDAFVRHGRRTMLTWSDSGYKFIEELDQEYSDWLCIPRSKKMTSVKPSGSVSLLPGVSAGIHHAHSEYYIRRIRIAEDHPLVGVMVSAGYHVEKDVASKGTKIVSFPVHEPFIKTKKSEVSIWQQVKDVVDYQRWWADNNVSVTVTFRPEEKKEIVAVLEAYEDSLKAISFLPLNDHGYKQAPYEEITKDRYLEMSSRLTKPDFSLITSPPEGIKFCDGDTCLV